MKVAPPSGLSEFGGDLMGLWMPGALKRHGPLSKVGYGANLRGPKHGDVKHSAEGWRANIMPIINGTRRASWHFTILTDGVIWQHYEIDLHCWHAGDADSDDEVSANLELVGIEHEGVAGTPLNALQIEATANVTQFCAAQFGRARDFARFPIQPSDGWTLVEHKQVSDNPTACPSNRIPWPLVLARLEPQENDMDPRLDEKIKTYSGDDKVFDIADGDGWRQDTLTYLQWMQYSALGWLRPSHEHDLTGKAR